MKKTILLLCAVFLSFSLFAEDDDDFFFDDEGIVELDTSAIDSRTDELNHGALFETGSIKIGGKFDTSISTTTTLWADDEETFATHLNDTILTPNLSAFLTLDARPTQTLRMYTKFGLAYPFKSSVGITGYNSFSIVDYLKVKEMFTDFSVQDRFFFRFGLHTVTWGTGLFYSPVSDMINTSSINPEDTDAQVDGAFNLRTQITFPGTQNCLWLYVIPSTDFTQGAQSYLRDTAFAGKADLVYGNWEFGLGAFYKHAAAPKLMFTTSGSIFKLSFFSELVYQYGGNSEWKDDDSWSNKTSIFQATAGVTYMWKDPSIVLAAQYYFDGNKQDSLIYLHGSDVPSLSSTPYADEVLIDIPRLTEGHNFAVLANFGKVFGSSDVTATVLGLVNIGRDDNYINEEAIKSIPQLKDYDMDLSQYNKITSIIFSAMLNYSPMDCLKFGAGPYITWEDFNSKPTVSLKLSATLGGGKF